MFIFRASSPTSSVSTGGKVRQIGQVSQGKLTLRLIDGARQAYSTLTVCGDLPRRPARCDRRVGDVA